MSNSSRVFADGDSSKIGLSVFAAPNELVLSTCKRRAILTVFNPYSSEAQFRILTTSPDRYDFSLTKGTIKPNRRIDISIRLLSHKIDELPEPTEDLQIIDYFRVSVQVGPLKGNRAIKVHWCSNEFSDTDDHVHLIGNEEKASKVKIKSTKQPHVNSSLQLNSTTSSSSQRLLPNQRSPSTRIGRSQVDHPQNGSNVNLVCTICAIACVVTLFLPLAIDSELCKKAKTFLDTSSSQSTGLLPQLSALLSIDNEWTENFLN